MLIPMRYVAQKEERTTAFSAFELEASAWTSMEVMAGTFGQRLIFFLVVSIARRLELAAAKCVAFDRKYYKVYSGDRDIA